MRKSLKKNIRSFRYSDEVAAILEQFDYNLEALVLDAYYRLPELQAERQREQQFLRDLQSEALKIRQDMNQMQMIGVGLDGVMERLLHINRLLDDLAAGRIR